MNAFPMDAYILLLSLFHILSFLFIHIILFRAGGGVKSSYVVFSRFVVSYILACVIGLYVGQLFLGLFDFETVVIMMGLSYVLLGLGVGTYLFGVFTIADSSIRFGILRTVLEAGSNGVRASKLEAQYSTHSVLQKRIARLVDSGEVIHNHGIYNRRTSKSLLSLRERFAHMLNRLCFVDDNEAI